MVFPMLTRDEMIREHYIKIDKIMSSRPRAQTGPNASFMGEMNKPVEEDKGHVVGQIEKPKHWFVHFEKPKK